VVVSLCGGHLLLGGWLGWLMPGLVEALAIEFGEGDAVGGVGDDEVEHRPGEREAAALAGEPADHLGSPLDLAERSLEQVR
jgi:hypothetical protein